MVLYDNGKKKLKNYRRHLKINCIKALKKCFESLLFEKWTQMNYFLFMAGLSIVVSPSYGERFCAICF